MKKMLNFILTLVILLNVACFNEKETNDKANGVNIYRNGNTVELYLNETYEGLEILVDKELNQEDIKSENLFIAKKEEGKTLIAVVGGETRLLSFKSTEAVEVNLVQKVTELKFEKKNLEITGNEKLLGDFSIDGEVDIIDFSDFAKAYGGTDLKKDVYPSGLGTGLWEGIYCYPNPDGLINIYDFIIFGKNFGKAKPEYNFYIEIPNIEFKIGEELELKAYIESNLGKQYLENVTWESSDETIATVNKNGYVKGIKGGLVEITAKTLTETVSKSISFISKEYYQDGEVLTCMKNQEDETKAINIIILGDGYIREDLKVGGALEQEGKKIIDGIFNNYAPYTQFKEYFNAYIIFSESNERGADLADKTSSTETGSYVDTVFNSTYWQSGIERLLVVGNGTKIKEYITNAGLDSQNSLNKNIMVISVNSPKYGGSGGYYSVVYRTEDLNSMRGVDVAVHEVGHSFAGLADEYDYGEVYAKSGAEFKVNTSLTNDLSTIKWKHFIGLSGYEGVGAYEGAYYYKTGVWRAEEKCTMRSLGQKFCVVCREKTVQTILSCAGEEYSFEEFVARDKVNLVPEYRKSIYETYEELPMIIGDDLRE